MKINQHPFPTNMLDAKGKAKVLTSKAAERSTSVDPQLQVTTADARGRGLTQKGTNSGRPPRSGIVITHRRPGKLGSSVRIDIGASRKIIVGKKKDADRSGISIGITGIARSSSIVGRRILSFPLSEIVLSATVMIGMVDPIGTITMIIGDLMGRLGEERPFTIGWGAGSVCTTGLAIVFNIFPKTTKNSKRWLMHGFPMSSSSAGMSILTGWSQEKIVAHR